MPFSVTQLMILPDFPEMIRRSSGRIQGRLHLQSADPLILNSLSIELRQVIPAGNNQQAEYEKVRLGSQSWYGPLEVKPGQTTTIEVDFSFSSRSQMEAHRLLPSRKAQKRMAKTLETLDLMRSEFVLLIRTRSKEGKTQEMTRPVKMIH